MCIRDRYLLQREVYNETQSIPSYVERVTKAILENALEEMKMQGHKMPVFVVEVDKKFCSASLENLLLLLKNLGHDNKLVQSVVILSSSHVAFGMKYSLLNLGLRTSQSVISHLMKVKIFLPCC